MSSALALLELASIAVGIQTGDAMVKHAPVDLLYAGTVHPGKYLVLVTGDVASVEEADAAADAVATGVIDRLFLPDAHPRVVAALGGGRATGGQGEAIGVFETRTVAAAIGCADRGVKGSGADLRELHLADALGGKAYGLFQGPIAEVEAAMELAIEGLDTPDLLIEQSIVARLHDDMRANLDAAPRFATRVASGAG